MAVKQGKHPVNGALSPWVAAALQSLTPRKVSLPQEELAQLGSSKATLIHAEARDHAPPGAHGGPLSKPSHRQPPTRTSAAESAEQLRSSQGW